MKPRKRHSGEAGYVAERMNPNYPSSAGKVVIYDADIQGIDVDGYRFAIVCDVHSSIGRAPSLAKARAMMKDPGAFCVDCRSDGTATPGT